MKDFYILRVENSIDIITNSSSELFVIKGDKQKEIILEMMNTAFENAGISYRASSYSLNESFTYDEEYLDVDYEKQKMMQLFGEDKHHLIEELFKVEDGKSNYYHFKFDRDDDYRLDYAVQEALTSIGFDYLGSEY